jgi:hypothetical protein
LLNIGAIDRDIVRVREMPGALSDDAFRGKPREGRRRATKEERRKKKEERRRAVAGGISQEIPMVLRTTRIQAAAAEPVTV